MQPLLAFDIGTLIVVIFVIIGIISKILQAAGAQGGGAAKPGMPRPPREERLKNEIENFLREVGGKRRAQAEEVPIEVVQDQPRRRPPRQQQQQGQRQPRRTPQPATGSKPAQPIFAPGSELQSRHLESGQLGQGVRGHLDTYMDERVGGAVQQHLGGTQEGRRAAAVQLARPGQAAVHPLVSLLRSPDGMRQAIVLSEILTRPSLPPRR